jgi:hypothetical protein
MSGPEGSYFSGVAGYPVDIEDRALGRATSPSPYLRESFEGWSSISDIPYAAAQKPRGIQYSDVGQRVRLSETSVCMRAWHSQVRC